MSMILSDLYDALSDSTTPEKAKAAAEEVADFETKISGMKSTLRMHSLILAYLVGAVSILLWKLFDIAKALP